MRPKKELSAADIAALKEKREKYEKKLQSVCTTSFLAKKIISLEDEIERLKTELADKKKDLSALARIYNNYLTKKN